MNLNGRQDGKTKYLLVDGGYIDFSAAKPTYMYYFKDHLGSNRTVAASNGTVVQVNHYYPYGLSFPTNEQSGPAQTPGIPLPLAGESMLPDDGPVRDTTGVIELPRPSKDQPWKFSGNELMPVGSMPAYDFIARTYDPSLGRFLSIDPLAEKYYSVSPYVFCAGNPVNFVDPDGDDFFRKIRKNTISIYAMYYTNSASEVSAKQAVAFWNKRSEDTYTNESGKTYTIKYILTVANTGVDLEKPKDEKDYKDKNVYNVSEKLVKKETSAGETTDRKHIAVRKSYSITKPGTNKKSTTGAHEIGHTLGMTDKDTGIMSRSQDGNRTSDVTQEDINEMMQSGNGKNDLLSKWFMD